MDEGEINTEGQCDLFIKVLALASYSTTDTSVGVFFVYRDIVQKHSGSVTKFKLDKLERPFWEYPPQ